MVALHRFAGSGPGRLKYPKRAIARSGLTRSECTIGLCDSRFDFKCERTYCAVRTCVPVET